MKDPVVLQQLQLKGVPLSDMEKHRYEAIERMPRVLDAAPPRIKLTRQKEIIPCGVAAEFKNNYNSIAGTVNTEVFYVDLAGQRQIQVVPVVYYVLKALVIQNVHVSEEVSEACSTLFQKIVMCGESLITESKLYDLLLNMSPQTYSAKELVSAIMQTCFETSPGVLYWNSVSKTDGYYSYALTRGARYIKEQNMDENDVKKFIKDNCKAAKEDKEFMKRLAKNYVNKALVAMIYALREDYKMFEVGNVSGGFMT